MSEPSPVETHSPGSTRPPALDARSLVVRLAIMGLIVGGLAAAFAYAGGWLPPHQFTAKTIVNGLEQSAGGPHPGFRRNHAKGVAFNGHFEGNGHGTRFSGAAVFADGANTPIVGRFALAGGQPFATDDAHTVRSMAVEFDLAKGEVWRSGMNDIPVFAVRSAQGFYDLTIATTPDPATGKPIPEKIKAFQAKYPESAAAMKQIGSRPISTGFDNDKYWSLNAFEFVAANGTVTPVRWAMTPVQPFVAIPTNPPPPAATGDTANAGTPSPAPAPNAEFDALIAAVHAHPLQWKLVVTIGQPVDNTADATIGWPPEREQVEVGTLFIEGIESEETSRVRDINFDPLVLPDGIRPSDDPLLSARSAAYSVSHRRREGEEKSPSAVTAQEVRQ